MGVKADWKGYLRNDSLCLMGGVQSRGLGFKFELDNYDFWLRI